MKICPPTVTLPLLGPPEFAATEYPTPPVPEPPEAPATVIHAALLAADQPHPAGAVTLTVPDSPRAPGELERGEIAYEHGIPAWVTVKV